MISALPDSLDDDPKAALCCALTKLRKVVDAADKPRIIAGRERVRFDTEGIWIDLRDLHDGLQQQREQVELAELEGYGPAA